MSDALLGHQVNYQNYYHVFIETLPTWHNIMCRYLRLCTYDAQSSLQLWLLEDRGPGAYTDLSFRLPALQPLYACLSPHPLRHIRDVVNQGKVIVVALRVTYASLPPPTEHTSYRLTLQHGCPEDRNCIHVMRHWPQGALCFSGGGFQEGTGGYGT